MVGLRPVNDGGGQCARLRDQCQRARFDQGAYCTGIQPLPGALNAAAVGANHPHAVLAGNVVQAFSLLGTNAVGDDQRRLAIDAASQFKGCGNFVVR